MLSGTLPNLIPDSAADPRVRDLEITRVAGIRAYASVPLRFPDGTKGSLCTLSHSPDEALAKRDLKFMHTLARLIEDHLERQHVERKLREGLSERMEGVEAELRMALSQLDASRHEVVLRLSRALDFRDDETGAHTERVGRLSEKLAEAAGLDPTLCELIGLASPLHDVGKVGIPDSVLTKPGVLTLVERKEMEAHAQLGYELLRNSTSEVIELAASIARTHHERFDGRGYPRGLAGSDIPVEGRIVAIVDVFDALTHDRVYRPALAKPIALGRMQDERGTHFDPDLLDVFVRDVVDDWDG
jgi:response regulator RpfG family c-di-GMP phosphodiesterase